MARTRLIAPLSALLLLGTVLAGGGAAIGQETDREANREELLQRARQEREQAEQAEHEARRAAMAEEARREREEARAALGGPTISLEFPGGSLSAYVEALKAAAQAQPTNILVRGNVGAIQISPTQLRDVSLYTALRLVSGDYQEGADVFRVDASNIGSDPAGGDIAYLVAVQSFGPRAPTRDREMLVLSLKEITTSLPGDPPEVVVPAETILTAVETAIAVAGAEHAGADLKYHAESGLLMMSGDGRTLSAAKEVVERIMGDVRERRDRGREIQRVQGLTNPDALEEQLADARAEAELAALRTQTADRQRAVIMQRFQEAQQRFEQGVTSADEMRQAEMEAQQAEAMVKESMIRTDRAQQRLARAEEALQRAKAIAGEGGPETEVRALHEENAMLRDRLAAMEAQIQQLREELAGRGRGGGTR